VLIKQEYLLKKELARVQQENDILKKAVGIFPVAHLQPKTTP
jgi:hypothetical protein